jgi:uncharacterized protein (UPF0212 family)
VNAVGLKGTCPHCGEEVEIILSKKQVKVILKALKAGNPAEAERITEQALGRDKKGDLKP